MNQSRKQINISLSAEEYEQVRLAANSARLPISTYGKLLLERGLGFDKIEALMLAAHERQEKTALEILRRAIAVHSISLQPLTDSQREASGEHALKLLDKFKREQLNQGEE